MEKNKGKIKSGPGRPRGLTEQGRATRRRLVEVALQRMVEVGYERATMRSIAKAAGVSPGLLYRYFPSKTAVVMELYEVLSVELQGAALPAGGVGVRFMAALTASLEVLRPWRAVLGAVLPLMLVDEEVGLFSERTSASRGRVSEVFLSAVQEASDAPSFSTELGWVLYFAHLGVVLWFVLERSQNQVATEGLLVLLKQLLPGFSLLLWLPGASAVVVSLHRLIRLAFFIEPADGCRLM